MKTWERFSSGLNRGLTVTGALLLLLIALGITAEVLLRKLFNTTLGGMDELAAYAFAFFTSLALSVAAIARANIRIDVLRALMPRPVRIGLDLVAQIALIAFTGFLTWRALLLVSASWAKGTKAITPLATPVAWPQTAWLAGLVIFLFVLVVMFLLSLRALYRRDLDAFGALAGPVGELDEVIPDAPAPGAAPQTTTREA